MKLVFLGPPGAGKGTYASRICEKKGWAHISTGDILREEIRKGSKIGIEAKKYVDTGQLVPDEMIIGILKERLKKQDCKNGFILDGFPRTVSQAIALEKITTIDAVLNLSIPNYVLISKILGRRTCERCGAIYNIADIRFGPGKKYHMPPIKPKIDGICDKCGGRLISRSDETEDIIKARLVVYKKQTIPLINFYKKRGLLKNVKVIGPPEVMLPKIYKVLGICEEGS